MNNFDNNMPIGQSISKCKDEIRSILRRLKNCYAPCDLDTVHGFSKNLSQSLNKAIDDFIADIEQFNCSNGITTDGTVKNKEVLHSVSISDCKDEPEMEIKSECTKYTEAQYKTTTRPVINGVRIKKSSNRTDSIDGSPFEEVPNSSNSKNWSNHRETSTHKLCADIPRINKSQKIKVIASAVGAKNYKSKTLKLSGNIECEFGVI